MSSNEYVETTRRLIRENPDLFDALLEFERTKKLPKLQRKKRVNFTVDSDLYREFQREAKRNSVNMSSVVERALKEELAKLRKK